MKNVTALSHVALIVKDIESMISFYTEFAEMELIHRRVDEGINVAWVRLNDRNSLTIVMIEEKSPKNEAYQRFNHFGFDCPSKEAVDYISNKGKEYNCIRYEAFDGGEVLGYMCMLKDPEGNLLEFAYGQMRVEKSE